MPATVSHALSATTPDDPAYEIRPSHWNSNHVVSFSVSATEISGLFSNAHGISFGLSESSITASHNALTTAMASNRGSDFVQAGAAFAGTSASGTIASNGISVSIGPYITTAMASNRGSDFVQAAAAFAGTSASGTIGSNGISVSIGPYITTGALSNHSHGNPTLALTNLTGTTASASDGFTLSLSAAAPGGGAVNFSAGTTSGNLASVVFSNSNGLAFGLNGSTITGSYTQSTHAHTEYVFSNSNGVSFGTNGSTVTATVKTDYLTTAMLSNAATISNIRVSAGTTSNLLSAITFSNSNGITFGLNASTMTASHNGLTTAALSDHSHGNPTLALTNLTGTTASASNGFTLSLSAAAAAGLTNLRLSAGTTSNLLSAVTFANSNGISFGIDASTVTASHNGLTTAALSNHSHGNPTLALTNISGTTASASNGLTLSLSAAAPGGGAAASVSVVEIMDGAFLTTAAVWNNATYSNRPIFVPFEIDNNLVSVRTVGFMASRTGGTSLAGTVHIGFYSRANETSFNLISSTSNGFSLTTSKQFSSIRSYQITGLSALALTPGRYVLGMLATIAGTASWGLNIIGGQPWPAAYVGFVHAGTNSTAATHSQSHLLPGWGVWNATSAALPAAVAHSSVSGGNAVNSPDIYAVLRAI